jgi:hypothetical protein
MPFTGAKSCKKRRNNSLAHDTSEISNLHSIVIDAQITGWLRRAASPKITGGSGERSRSSLRSDIPFLAKHAFGFRSHYLVSGSIPALRNLPLDQLERTLQTAGLAVQTVGRAQNKLAIIEFIHLGRTKCCARMASKAFAAAFLLAVSAECDMGRLILSMPCP